MINRQSLPRDVVSTKKIARSYKKMDAVLERSAAALLMVVLITAFYDKGQE